MVHKLAVGPSAPDPTSDLIYIPPLPSIAISALMMEAVCFSETLVSVCECIRRQNLEELYCHTYYRENLKSLRYTKLIFGMSVTW